MCVFHHINPHDVILKGNDNHSLFTSDLQEMWEQVGDSQTGGVSEVLSRVPH
jgi:hypothetical protein